MFFVPKFSLLRRLSGIVLFALLAGTAAFSQPAAKPPPTHVEVRYGPHERNVLDFWQAESKRPTPFVVFIHGGGFAQGSKDNLRPELLRELLAAGISVAAINYRYYHQAALPAALHDARRALQFIRSRAAEWNLDRGRAAATGGSAGAIASMYLAFHDEMADAASANPVARESTRLTCVATTAGQTTLDIDWWVANVPGWPQDEGVKADVHAARRWGAPAGEPYRALVASASALNLVSPDDPPIWMSYAMSPEDPPPPEPRQAVNARIHHVNFGVALKEKMDRLGVEAHLVHPGRQSRDYRTLGLFLIAKLGARPDAEDGTPNRARAVER